MNKKLHIQWELCTPQLEPECTISNTFWQRHVHATIFQVEWCTSYQYYAVYSNAIPIWHITFVLHTSGVAGLAANTTSICVTSLLAPFTGILIVTHIIELMYSSHIKQQLDCFLFLLCALPACCCIIILNSISNLCPSLDSQSWCTSSWNWLYCSNPSVFHGIFFCPGFVYLVLAGMMLLGTEFSPHFISVTICSHGSQ
jgi:hypothetical protein